MVQNIISGADEWSGGGGGRGIFSDVRALIYVGVGRRVAHDGKKGGRQKGKKANDF